MSVTTKTELLDGCFLGESHVIGTYVMESDDGLVIVDSGPETVFENFKSAFAEKGWSWKDVKHVLLTHIHFDHAGAAWKFAENGAKIYVHPIGLPHLENPERLWNSAKQIYGEDMERLWGEMQPIDGKMLVPVEDGDVLKIGNLNFNVIYTPGHAIHHNAYQLDDGIFTGDVGGVKINHGPVVPPCPPPDINIEDWKNSIGKIREKKPRILYPAHFGAITDVEQHLTDLEEILDDWAAWIKPHFDAGNPPEDIIPEFQAYTQNQLREKGVSEEDVVRYEKGNPSFMSVTGLLRYWKLKTQGRI